ncbi:M56 family metallopeptidase [Pedobacter lusitanus]|uniref:M56 family metallopeptidase n=1 Tax=Pedobacter lusitanus TaxID=1503925 RepID=UPI0006965611|nr:M56 family metallopeptidase [Pedobacter lusitanus]
MEALLNNLIQATGWSILHSLWQAAIIYALLLPSQIRVFQLKAKVKYNLAYLANVIIFISFAITFFTVFKWPSENSTIVNTIGQPAQPDHSPLALTVINYAEKIFPFLVLFYGAGLTVQSIILFKGYRKIQDLKKAARLSIPEEWKTLFENMVKKMVISKNVSFHLSDHVNVPLVIGFFKPVVLFPVALAAQMDMKHVEAILIHELSHIRRNDYLFNLIRTMIDTILFFNPFVWLTGKFIDIEREHACDDLVVTLTNTPLTYAHALLQVELLTDKTSPLFALAATGKNQHLYQRIKRITDMKTNYMNSKQKLFAVTLIIATIASLAWISPAKSEKPKKSVRSLATPTVTVPSVQLPADTSKKKLKRIIIVHKNGDSTKDFSLDTTILSPDRPNVYKTTYLNHINIPADKLNIRIDSVLSPKVTVSIANFATDVRDMVIAGLASDESKLASMTASMEKKGAELEKRGAELEKKFNSPEEKAKWAKYAAEMQAKYDNTKERAKWEKMAREMRAKYDSPAQRERLKKITGRNRINRYECSKKWSALLNSEKG